MLVAQGAAAAPVETAVVQLRVEPAYFSPNDDGFQDQLFLYPVLKSNQQVQRWTLDILAAKKKKRVATLSGGGLPALIKWDGLDKKGALLPEGNYIGAFTALSKKKNFKIEQSFYIDQTPPVGTIALSTAVFDKTLMGNGTITVTPGATDASPIDHWLVQVVDTGGRTAFLYWSSGTVHDVQWDGTNRVTNVLVPQGDYRVLFQAWDKAGNQGAPVFADLKVNVTAREMLERSIKYIQITETPMGLVVQIDAERCFQKVRNRISLTEAGQILSKETAILINAYPNATVKLEGYSRANKKSVLDQSQSSIYAWRVYSYLTKNGNVRASRLTVRGRGRSPMFDRRSINLPVLKNGVEVILDGGGRPW